MRMRRDVGLVLERAVPGRTDDVRIVSCWISRIAVSHEDGVVKLPRCAGRCWGCKRQAVCEYVFGEEQLVRSGLCSSSRTGLFGEEQLERSGLCSSSRTGLSERKEYQQVCCCIGPRMSGFLYQGG